MRISEKKSYKVSLSDKDGKFLGSRMLSYHHTLYGLVSNARQFLNNGMKAKFADIQCVEDNTFASYRITSSGDLKRL